MNSLDEKVPFLSAEQEFSVLEVKHLDAIKEVLRISTLISDLRRDPDGGKEKIKSRGVCRVLQNAVEKQRSLYEELREKLPC